MTDVTIQQILINNLKSDNNKGIHFVDAEYNTDFLSYKKLYLQASYLSNSLLEQGMCHGNELVFQFQSNKDFIITFWACIFSKIIPVPISFGVTKEIFGKISNLWGTLKNPYLISDLPSWVEKFSRLENQRGTDKTSIRQRFISYQDLEYTKKAPVLDASPNDIFFIQYSSGSTGVPKGVVITQENLLYNVSCTNLCLGIDKEDTFLSWLPLSHDMGLVVFHLIPILNNVSQYLFSSYLFLIYPEMWLRAMTKFEITISGSPNFGYKYVIDCLEDVELNDIDLSKMRFMINSSEPVSIDLCNSFVKALSPHGLKNNVLRPGYGLSEAVSGVCISTDEFPIRAFYLNRNELVVGKEVKFFDVADKNAAAFADLGPVIGTEIKIKDEEGNDLPNDTLGVVYLKGKGISKGYYNLPDPKKKVFSEGGWFNTGDLGLVHNGHLILTGREKEMIVVNGKNYFPNDLDKIIEELPMIQFQQVATCVHYNQTTQRDNIYVFLNFKGNLSNFSKIEKTIRQHFGERTLLGIEKVIPVNKIAKTTSGKIQRHLMVENYLCGRYDDYINQCNSVAVVDKSERPITTEAKILLEIWESVFEMTVTPEDSFFQLGGDSLKAMKLISRINRKLGVLLNIEDIFQNGSFKYQLEQISNNTSLEKIDFAPNFTWYPVSDAQRRFYVTYLLDDTSVDYNIPIVLKVLGDLDIARCQKTFEKIIDRHEALRTVFELDGIQIVQKIIDKVRFSIEVLERNNEPLEEIVHRCVTPFQLDISPLGRVFAIKEQNKVSYLILDFHHIVMDLTSYNIYSNEQ